MVNMEVKGYKVFNHDWTCRGFKYEVGQTYEEDVRPSVCGRGFHFCKRAVDCFNYYPFDPSNKVAEVVALGEVAESGDKCCTNKIKIVREISWEELLSIVNTGKGNTGLCNSGDRNTGDFNIGDFNTGNRNTGNRNAGDWNTGNRNSGNCNTGTKNTGDYNTGNFNTGDWNTGYWNTGDFNTGDCNTGDWNTGDCNTGYWNTGDFNTGDCNVGCFNTENQKLRFFDREADMTFEEWRDSEAYRILQKIPLKPARWICVDEMTEAEKAEHPEYKTTGGYLKEIDTSNCYIEWWNNLDEDEKNIIKSIPNFDAEKFYLITGIKVE